ncbi:MAG: leucine--tRNA ligase, partial [Desulfurococcaceae archaeon]
GEDDIEDADINPVDIIEYVSIKFRLKNSDEYLLASTLRPETLFGATNIWVNPDATYVTISWRNERLILSREALVKFKYQHPNDNVTVINEIRGYELVGRKAYSPLGTELLILPAEFVDPGNATGIVYSEPSDAPYDYVALMDIKNNPVKLEKYGISIDEVKAIEPIKIIDVPGVNGHHAEIIVKQMGIIDQRDPRLEDATRIVYKEQFYKGRMIVEDPVFKGLSVQEAKERMRNRLYSMNQAIPFYEVSRKAKCRSGGEIIVAKISDQWFIDYSLDWLKNSGKKFVEEKLIVIPDKYKKSILNTIDWLDKRPCARKRGLGTKLPFDKDWIIESLSDSTIYMAFYTIVHHIRNAGLKPEQLKPSLFDYVFLGLGDPVKVSEETGINVDLVEKMRREFLYWYPVDLRHTGVAHLSNHLTFYILNHIAIFGEEHWPRMITLNELVIREGDKMSKSKGNVILLREIAEKYSADVFRLYVASAANLDTVLDWREKDVLSVLDSLKKFIDIASESIKANCRKPMNRLIDKWFFSRFNKLLREASESLDKMEIRDYIQKIFFQFLKLFDKYREATCDEDSYCITRTVLDKLLKALNPVIPHVTEEIWEWMGGEKFLSLQNWPTPDDFLINDELEILFDNLDRIVDDLKNVLAVYKPVKNTAYIIVASPWKREAISLYVKWRDTRKVIEEIRDKYGLKGREQEIVSVVNQFIKEYDENIIRTSTDLEYAVYSEAKNYIEKKTSLNIRVVWEEEARSLNIPRANRAYPLKPAFYIE